MSFALSKFNSSVVFAMAFVAISSFEINVSAQGFSTGYAPSWNSNSWNGGDWGSSNWPSSSGPRNSWKLGVTGKNTEVGVLIDSVTPNSAAARIGLTVGDLIICVNGDQVGTVGSKIFDMAEELNQHADSAGRVRLLVQFRRTGRLQNIPVQLDGNQPGLSGTLMIQNGTVPSNSIITVQLQNESRPYFVIRNGQQTFRAPSSLPGSIPFSINFDPSYISPNDRYYVRAFVTYNGNTIYETTQPYYVLTQGYPSNVQLLLSAKSVPFGNQPVGAVTTVSYGGYDNISAQVTSAYQRYLGRNPTSLELAAWHSVPSPDLRIRQLPAELMANQEYFDRCGNNNVAWLERVFTEVIGHVPSSYEQQLWMGRFAEERYSRTEILRQMYMVTRNR